MICPSTLAESNTTPSNNELHAFDPQGKKVIDENVEPTVKELTPYVGAEHAENLVGQIENYHDNAPGEPDPDMFYDSARENYDIDEREVPDENHEFEPTNEREAFDEHVKEMARKYGLDPKRTVWNDLTDKLTTEEQEEGRRSSKKRRAVRKRPRRKSAHVYAILRDRSER